MNFFSFEESDTYDHISWRCKTNKMDLVGGCYYVPGFQKSPDLKGRTANRLFHNLFGVHEIFKLSSFPFPKLKSYFFFKFTEPPECKDI